MDHEDFPNDNETRRFSTIYASGYIGGANFHYMYVSEIHMIPNYNTQNVECVYDQRHIVSNNIVSPSPVYVS